MKKLLKIWHKIEEYNIATNEEIKLVVDINGFSKATLIDIIFARTGYHSLKQFETEELNKQGV